MYTSQLILLETMAASQMRAVPGTNSYQLRNWQVVPDDRICISRLIVRGSRGKARGVAMSMRIARPVMLNHIVSPYGIAIISTLFFLVALIFPSQLYTSLVSEPDLMFMDSETLLFFLLCVAGFWAGLLIVDFLLPTPELLESSLQPSRLTGLRLLLPLIVTTIMTALAGLQMLRQSPNLLILLLAQQGGAVKAQFAELQLGLLGWGATMQTVVLWWTYWKLINFRPNDSRPMRGPRFLFWLVFAIGLMAQVALSMLRVSRSDLMPVFGGLAILYLMHKIHRKKLRTSGLLCYLLLFPSIAMFLFIVFGLLRGVTDLTTSFGDFVGYTFASYNRLTALLHGTMHYPYGGHGAYLSMSLTTNNFLNAIFHLREAFGWPSYFEIWNSEFQAPQLAGLNSYLIWSGAFGYLFSDFGWATPLILMGYGVVYGLVWREAKSGTALGLTLYPWFAFSALSWFSSNLVFDYRFPFFVVGGLLLMAYERLLSSS
jgi:hypothetical protein